MTITLPPELVQALADEARKLKTTPDKLAVDSLLNLYAPLARTPLTLEEHDALLKQYDEEMAACFEGKTFPNLPITREEIYQDHP